LLETLAIWLLLLPVSGRAFRRAAEQSNTKTALAGVSAIIAPCIAPKRIQREINEKSVEGGDKQEESKGRPVWTQQDPSSEDSQSARGNSAAGGAAIGQFRLDP
jgi:hypothetical protein